MIIIEFFTSEASLTFREKSCFVLPFYAYFFTFKTDRDTVFSIYLKLILATKVSLLPHFSSSKNVFFICNDFEKIFLRGWDELPYFLKGTKWRKVCWGEVVSYVFKLFLE